VLAAQRAAQPATRPPARLPSHAGKVAAQRARPTARAEGRGLDSSLGKQRKQLSAKDAILRKISSFNYFPAWSGFTAKRTQP